MAPAMTIGEAATATGVSAKMIRHYEQIGLLPQAARTDAGYRLYGERELAVLRFIRQARHLGFSMAQIAELIELWSNTRRSSRSVKKLAQVHLADLDEKIRELTQMKQGLEQLIALCAGNEQPHCAILDRLAAQGPDAHTDSAAPTSPPRRSGKTAAPSRRHAQVDHSAASAPYLDLMAWARQSRSTR